MTATSAAEGGPLGLLGGTFDPVHHGHLRLALEMQARLGLAEVRLMPLASPPHRPAPAAPADFRAAMVAAAIAEEPQLRLDRREIDRGGVSYTIDTLEHVRSEVGARPLFLILGMDAFLGVLGWRDWQRIPRLAHLAVAYRPGADVEAAAELREVVLGGPDAPDWRRAPAGAILFEAIPPLDISSSQIRANLRSGGNVRYLLPDAVLALIRQRRTYER